MRAWFLFLKAIFTSTLVIGFFIPSALASSGGITVIPDASVFIQMINFIFLIWILNTLLFKPIRNILLKRKQEFEGLE